jgi:hypothetical protein
MQDISLVWCGQVEGEVWIVQRCSFVWSEVWTRIKGQHNSENRVDTYCAMGLRDEDGRVNSVALSDLFPS